MPARVRGNFPIASATNAIFSEFLVARQTASPPQPSRIVLTLPEL
jgi:hypothetical protein